jgi:NTP pyrophosphatase (non-canonical NTP hydrolase)
MRDARQKTVADWCAAAFGIDHASSLPQRGIRLVEEAIEAAQAAGCERAMVHKLVDYVFDRPAGTIAQELGGVGVTALALAQAAGLSADKCEADEVARVLAKPLEHFTARNQVKNAAGFNTAALRSRNAIQGK